MGLSSFTSVIASTFSLIAFRVPPRSVIVVEQPSSSITAETLWSNSDQDAVLLEVGVFLAKGIFFLEEVVGRSRKADSQQNVGKVGRQVF